MTSNAPTVSVHAVPDLIHEYARVFYEAHLRCGSYRIFSHRAKFDAMTDGQVSAEYDRVKAQVIEQFGKQSAAITPDEKAALGRFAAYHASLDKLDAKMSDDAVEAGEQLGQWLADWQRARDALTAADVATLARIVERLS